MKWSTVLTQSSVLIGCAAATGVLWDQFVFLVLGQAAAAASLWLKIQVSVFLACSVIGMLSALYRLYEAPLDTAAGKLKEVIGKRCPTPTF